MPDMVPATGVSARWYFELRVEEEFARGLRDGTPITLVCVRPDADKSHQLARRLKAALRSYDLIGSLDDGRIAVAIINSGRAQRGLVTVRLQDALGETPEMGVACFPEDGITFESVLQRAESRTEPASLAA